MQVETRDEHRWLQRLAGTWAYESDFQMAPDQPPMKCTGTETIRMLGEVWAISEGKGTMPDGGTGTVQFTIGFDPAKNSFVGTFVGSMMTHLWVYERGTLDASGKALTLEAEGPNCMATDGALAKFRDTVALDGPDRRTLTSEIQQADGSWRQMMTIHYVRTNAAALAAE